MTSSSNLSIGSNVVLGNLPEYLESREKHRFFLVDRVDQWLQEYKISGEQETKFLEVLEKVIIVVTAFLSIFLQIGWCYLPTAVFWGVGVPSIAILLLSWWGVSVKSESNRSKQQYHLLLNGFFKSHPFNPFRPIGEWNLKETDARLKSDELAENELEIKHLQGAKELEKSLGLKTRNTEELEKQKGNPNTFGDPEISVQVPLYATDYFTDSPKPKKKWEVKKSNPPATSSKLKDKWKKVKKANNQAIGLLRNGDVKGFENKKDEALLAAYHGDGENPMHPVNFPFSSARGRVESLVHLYRAFERSFFEVKKLYLEGAFLYRPYRSLNNEMLTPWQNHLDFVDEIDKEITPLIALLDNKETKAVEFLSALKNAEKAHLSPSLFNLLDQTHTIKGCLNEWIAVHPKNRCESLEKKMKELEKKVLSNTEVKALADWMLIHPSFRDEKVEEYLGQGSNAFKEWIKGHPDLRSKPLSDVYNLLFEMRKKLNLAQNELSPLQKEFASCGESEERYTSYIKALNQFEKETFGPLNSYFNTLGESQIQMIFRVMFSKSPASSVVKEKIPEEKGPLRSRKINEVRLNGMLSQINSKMISTHRALDFGVNIPILLLFAIEGIFTLYVATPYFYWGCCALSLVGQGVSYYVKERLKQMNKEKQATKLQLNRLLSPSMGGIPGTNPELARLNKIKGELGVDEADPEPALSRDLTVGKKEYPELDREALLEFGKEQSSRAGKYLEDALIMLKSRCRRKKDRYELVKYKYDQAKKELGAGELESERVSNLEFYMNKLGKKVDHLNQRIQSIEATLEGRATKAGEFKLPAVFDLYIEERNRVDADLDKVVEELIGCKRKEANYKKVSDRFSQLERQIPILQKNYESLLHQFYLVQEAMKGEKVSDANQNREAIEKLKALPMEDLLLQEEELKKSLTKLPRAEYAREVLREHRDYGSKEGVDEKRGLVQERYVELEKETVKLKARYDALYFLKANNKALQLLAPCFVACNPKYRQNKDLWWLRYGEQVKSEFAKFKSREVMEAIFQAFPGFVQGQLVSIDRCLSEIESKAKLSG